MECLSFRENGEDIRQFEVAYFTASCDREDMNAEFAKSLKLDYPILSDPSRETAKAYGVVQGERKHAKRWTFFIGKDGKILAINKKVKSKGHAKAVVEQLAVLQVEKSGKETRGKRE